MENRYSDLDNKIQSMTAKEIILAMVESLRNPVTVVDMGTYGGKNSDGVCFGCAATNNILRLGGLDPKEELQLEPLWGLPEEYTKEDMRAVHWFERAINALRSGDVIQYNTYARRAGAAGIKRHEDKIPRLPFLDDMNYYHEENLQIYIDLANDTYHHSEAAICLRDDIVEEFENVFYPHSIDESEEYRLQVQLTVEMRLAESNATVFKRAIEGFIEFMKGGSNGKD